MTLQHTQLTQQDLRIYKSQRNTDTDDGGGAMTSTPLTGKDNELFNPISDVDRTMGAFDARLTYAAVLRGDDSALLGANVIVSQPPEQDNVSVLMLPADYDGQERLDMMRRAEAYSVYNTETRMVLFGKHTKGAKQIQVYQDAENKNIPKVGERFALVYTEDDTEKAEYFRVGSVSSQVETFEVEDGSKFDKRVIIMGIQAALNRDFNGVNYPVRGYANAPIKVYQTQIADSAKYYGIRALAAPLQQGSASAKVDSIFEQLVPTSTDEKTLVDSFSGGVPVWLPIAPRRVVARINQWVSGSVYLECSVLPGSVELGDWTDTAQGSLKKHNTVLSVDYANGVISGLNGVWIGEINAVPAASYRNYGYSSKIRVDATTIGTDFTALLRPLPALGSVGVSYRAQGAWYDLSDSADGVLRDELGQSRGTINARTGSVAISLPTVPEVNSNIEISWSPVDFYKTFDGGDLGAASSPKQADAMTQLPDAPKQNLKPSTIRLTWNDGAERVATDSDGKLVGSCQGTVNYAGGTLSPVNLNAASVRLTAQQYSGIAERKEVATSQDDNGITLLVGAPIQKGTLSLQMELGRSSSLSKDVIYDKPKLPFI
ncbi:hypothetical protein [Kingella negevensis]|uniref:hypothetical protein n=1 Tax=Kingella negevensis TaxID=1522312 RepID=UPI0006935648|nr:hypothetical protein [Kingella negevensis]MDK4689696.1 hypothetical protein [Kingella negevensis]WII91769.1 hypothetical protein QEO93_04070 [Kingella negevensis]